MQARLIAAALLGLAALVRAAEAPHEVLAQLDSAVGKVASLSPGQKKSLQTKLAHAADALETGDGGATAQRLKTFVSEVRALEKGKSLSSKEAAQLSAAAISVSSQIDAIATTPVTVDRNAVQLCPAQCEKKRELLFVDARPPGTKPDGSANNPFQRIGDAMDRARALAFCRVEIVIAAGRYSETVIVDRDLILRGSASDVIIEGSVLNFGGYALEVHSLTLLNSPNPGAIVSGLFCASTVVRDVRIQAANGYGIRQTGGALEIYRSAIIGTRGDSSESASGAGVRVSGGVKAAMRHVTIDENSGGGLLIEGASTRVYAAGVLVRRNRMNAALAATIIESAGSEGGFLPGVAGVEVRDGVLLLEWFGIEQNQMAGLFAARGARVAARYGVVTESEMLRIPRGLFGGIGIVTWDEKARRRVAVPAEERAVLDLKFVSSLRHPLSGLTLSEAFATTERSPVQHNEMGLVTAFLNSTHAELPSYERTFRCVDLSRIRHNGINSTFEFGYPIPVPEVPDCIECPTPPPPRPPCRTVPFVCTWCA